MPKGGARVRSGPAPDPNALNRERKNDPAWTVLPIEGRKGRTPAWPLGKASAREKARWAELWKRPQAVMWEQLNMHDQVALYVRRWCEAEVPQAPVNLSTLVKQMGDGLGLTIPGMHSLRWKLAADEVSERRAVAPVKSPASMSVRDRLRAVNDSTT